MSLRFLSLNSEPYGVTGNIGKNIRRLLGTPTLDPLQTVIREAIQNVADAAKLGAGPDIVIRLYRLSDNQRTVFSGYVFKELPREKTSRDALSQFLEREDALILEICDFRTCGLGGPTRADRIPIGTKQTDFIDFLRNIGMPRDTEHGGGTYGFGKVALYQVSRCHTILVDTLVHNGGKGARRLIGSHIGESFGIQEDGMCRRFTGRHWWGMPDPSDGFIDPIMDTDAENMASALGFLPRNTPDKTGSSIMILDFDSEGEDPNVIGHRIVESLLWSFWPRMLEDTPADRQFNCTVEVEGTLLDIPKPETFSPLDLFAKAFRAARAGSGNDVHKITSKRPSKDLGCLAMEKGLRTARRPLVSENSLFPAVCHHIALMRPVELIVKYLEGPALPDERLEWAGVFITSSEDAVEHAFAESEPPAHDDWIPSSLPKGRAKTYVNVALRELRAHALDFGNLPDGPRFAGSDSGPPLAKVAGVLGLALEGTGGDGAGRKQGGGRPGRRTPLRARASRPVFQRLEHDSENTMAVFTTEISQDNRQTGAVLNVNAYIAIEGAAAGRAVDSIASPSVVRIRSADGTHASNFDRIDLSGKGGRYEIFVRMPSDCAVTVDAQIMAGSDR